MDLTKLPDDTKFTLRDGRPVKVCSFGLSGTHPILGIYMDDFGRMVDNKWTREGYQFANNPGLMGDLIPASRLTYYVLAKSHEFLTESSAHSAARDLQSGAPPDTPVVVELAIRADGYQSVSIVREKKDETTR